MHQAWLFIGLLASLNCQADGRIGTFYGHHTFESQRILLVSFDGFRHDYIQRYQLENLQNFLKQDKASKAAYISPQFTTQTFPNHWSLVTGAYVETHGVIANAYFDPKFNKSFSREKPDSAELKWWNFTEPIWFQAIRQSKKVGTYHWPGSDVMFLNDNQTNSYYRHVPYNQSTSFQEKVGDIIDWFVKERFTFVSLYHPQPDGAGHRYGIDSSEFNKTIREVDLAFGYLMENLKRSELYDATDFNLLIVSDHGMVNIRKHVFLDDYFKEGVDGEIWSESTNLIHIKPLIDRKQLLEKLSHMPNTTSVYRNNLPNYLYYKHHYRIGEVVVTADLSVAIIHMGIKKLRGNKTAPVDIDERKKAFVEDCEKASHGFNQLYEEMRGVLMVRGALFKQGFSLNYGVENIDVYPLMCHLLAIRCEQRNGSFERVSLLLNKASSLLFYFNAHLSTAVAFLSLFLIKRFF